MQFGYILCTPDHAKVLCVKKDSKKVELKEVQNEEVLNEALCLNNLTSLKNIYERFKELKLVDELDIVNIAEIQNRLHR